MVIVAVIYSLFYTILCCLGLVSIMVQETDGLDKS